MSQSVTIKSNKYGINLVLDPEIGFDELLKDVVEKFKASSTFFKNAKLALVIREKRKKMIKCVFVRRNERNTIAGRTGFFKSFK